MIHDTALDAKATAAQHRMLFALWKQAGVVDRSTRLHHMGVMLNRDVDTSATLTRTEART